MDFQTFRIVAAGIIGPKITSKKKDPEGFPVLIRGAHGVGKSEVVYQIARDLGLPVVERRASQMTEGDLIGLPRMNEKKKTTSFNPPDWFYEACSKPVVLFMDELDRAIPEVRQGFFELADSRKIFGQVLHPGTKIFAAVNGGKNAPHYQVSEMDPAESDRWWIVDVEPSVDDWLQYAAGKVHQTVWDFIAGHFEHLEHKGTYDPSKIYPSRRSWFRLSECADRAGFFTKETTLQLYSLAAGFVGEEAAIALRNYAETLEYEVSPAQVLAGERRDRYPTMELNEHNSILNKFKNGSHLAKDLSDAEMGNLMEYWEYLPPENAILLFTSLAAKDTGYHNIKLWHGKKYPKANKWSGIWMADIVSGFDQDELTEKLKELQGEDDES